MSEDNIFNAFAVAEAVWPEIDRLATALPALFAPEFGLTPASREELGDWASSRYGYHFSLRRLVPRERHTAALLVALDLARPEAPSSWPHARTALLTCAYSPRFSDGWDLEHVVLGMDGRPALAETTASYTLDYGDRLLVWQEPAEEWRQSSWLFSIPLLAINSTDALQRLVVQPVLELLRAPDRASDPLTDTMAVQFAQPLTG